MNAEPAGWYGKIASLGDFAHRRLPAAWITRCDAWLSTALPVARAALGPRWLDTYLTAPVLRFAWAPGVVDGHWWIGILMPSCDNVGRYFPLIIARRLAKGPSDAAALGTLAGWYEQVTQIALATLDDARGSLAALEGALGAMTAPPMVGPPYDATVAAGPPARPGTLFPSNERLPLSGVTGRSLWWVADAPSTDRLEAVEGLPDGVRFAGLLAKGSSIEGAILRE